jgi:hypothetical protein
LIGRSRFESLVSHSISGQRTLKGARSRLPPSVGDPGIAIVALASCRELKRKAALPDALEDAGFGLELLRGCDPQFPVAFRGSVGLFLEWFGWEATRANMARVLSHRWAWEAFLQQSDARYAVICEDGIGWRGTEIEMRERCKGLGDGAWLVDLTDSATGAGGMVGVGEAFQCGQDTTGWKPVFHDRPEAYPPIDGRAYCLSREAARLLLERDYCNARALVNPHDPISPLSVRSADREWASGSSVLATGTPPATGKILVGICSLRMITCHRLSPHELHTVHALMESAFQRWLAGSSRPRWWIARVWTRQQSPTGSGRPKERGYPSGFGRSGRSW